MAGDSINFKDLLTGEKKSYALKRGEHESILKCPLDGTSLIIYDEWAAPDSNYVLCPNCKTNYGGPTGNTQERIKQRATIIFSKIPNKLEKLEKEKKTLEKKLDVAISKGLIEQK